MNIFDSDYDCNHASHREMAIEDKLFLFWRFPEDKKWIAKLSHDQKMQWYAYQLSIQTFGPPLFMHDSDFQIFWKWRVLIPMKLKRFYFRLKNLEIFKHYESITEMKKKVKKHSI